MMQPWSIDRLLKIHSKIDYVGCYLKHSVDDGRSARTSNYHKRLSIFQQDGRSHSGKRPLVWRDCVRFALQQTIQIRYAWLRCEIIHFIVQKKAASRNSDS